MHVYMLIFNEEISFSLILKTIYSREDWHLFPLSLVVLVDVDGLIIFFPGCPLICNSTLLKFHKCFMKMHPAIVISLVVV